MANKKITELNELTAPAGADALPVVDVSSSETKKIKLENLPVSIPAQDALNLKANSADVYTKAELDQKIRRAKKTISIQLDTPSPNPSIAPGASHTYVIDLGAQYEQVALTNFQWVAPSNISSVPDAVVANACFPKQSYGGVLIVNKTPGGWVRSFEMAVSEYQSGDPSDVDAPWSADSSDIDAPLGYGSSALQVPIDHTAVQTLPPKKLQIEDIYIDGQNLKVTIKNYDSVSIDLSPYVGVTGLFDEERNANIGAVSENGTIAYSAWWSPEVRVSEDGGKTFFHVFPTKNQPSDSSSVPQRLSSMALTNNSTNTFLGLFNYSFVKVAQSPGYIFENRYNVKTNLGNNFNPTLVAPLNASRPAGGKTFDWKKTDSESCSLFAGFMNYYSIAVYKSVDDCYSYGNNAPDFDNNQPIFNSDGFVSSDLPDFRNASTQYESYGNVELTKAEVKVINNDVHYLSLSYWSKDETFNNGLPSTDVIIGPQTIIGQSSVPFELRSCEVAFVVPYYFNSAFGKFKIEGSTLGNDSLNTTYSTGFNAPMEVYYAGGGIFGAEAVTMESSEIAIPEAQWNANTTHSINSVTYGPAVGDEIETFYNASGNARILGIRTATIDGQPYVIIKQGTVFQGDSVQFFTYSIEDGGGSPLPFWYVRHKISSGRYYNMNGKQYWVFVSSGTTFNSESSPTADPSSTSPNLKHTFVLDCGTMKQKLLKTTDGGDTWDSIMEHDDFRYANYHTFYSSNDGQTLMLAIMKYWSSIGYEKFPYPMNPSEMGGYARFNISTDGGATWRNAPGSWDYLGKNLVNTSVSSTNKAISGRSPVGQVMGKIDNEVLAIMINDDRIPVLYRSTDNGITWSAPVQLKNVSNTQGVFEGYSPDSKDQFLAFFGHHYSLNSDQYIYYGAKVESYTQWKGFGVK
jgi:hypothetical protein